MESLICVVLLQLYRIFFSFSSLCQIIIFLLTNPWDWLWIIFFLESVCFVWIILWCLANLQYPQEEGEYRSIFKTYLRFAFYKTIKSLWGSPLQPWVSRMASQTRYSWSNSSRISENIFQWEGRGGVEGRGKSIFRGRGIE